MTTPALVENFFRHEYGRLVAVLTRQVGIEQIESVEDAVQCALAKALESWTNTEPVENPSGWLYRVARNELIGALRQDAARQRLLRDSGRDLLPADLEITAETLLPSEIQDDLLRMLFVCCDDSIPWESQLALALKVLCGFSVPEIALRLFTSEANVYQRLNRARKQLRKTPPDVSQLTVEHCRQRLSGVQRVIYLMFTEGYLSNHAEFAIRRELCREALRLTEILTNHPAGKTPSTFALRALLHLHLSRLSGREDGAGGLLLLEEQDRAQWDQEEIERGMTWLAKSAEGDEFTRYHAEAGIAAEHCLAPSFDETRWQVIAGLYALLEQAKPSAIHRLNRAVALAECRGPEAGLKLLEEAAPSHWVEGSYLWAAVRADLLRRSGDTDAADAYRQQALDLAPNAAVRALLARRLLVKPGKQ